MHTLPHLTSSCSFHSLDTNTQVSFHADAYCLAYDGRQMFGERYFSSEGEEAIVVQLGSGQLSQGACVFFMYPICTQGISVHMIMSRGGTKVCPGGRQCAGCCVLPVPSWYCALLCYAVLCSFVEVARLVHPPPHSTFQPCRCGGGARQHDSWRACCFCAAGVKNGDAGARSHHWRRAACPAATAARQSAAGLQCVSSAWRVPSAWLE